MAECAIHVHAPPEHVFDVLRDPASYVIWVVGSKHIRGVQPDWPQPGSKLHHTVGWGPFEDHDNTEVLEIDAPHRLVLKARAWPFGTAKVELTLQPDAGGTDLRMRETPLEGPAARMDNAAMEGLLQVRNLWSLRRLGRWAEERYRGRPGHQPEPA